MNINVLCLYTHVYSAVANSVFAIPVLCVCIRILLLVTLCLCHDYDWILLGHTARTVLELSDLSAGSGFEHWETALG